MKFIKQFAVILTAFAVFAFAIPGFSALATPYPYSFITRGEFAGCRWVSILTENSQSYYISGCYIPVESYFIKDGVLTAAPKGYCFFSAFGKDKALFLSAKNEKESVWYLADAELNFTKLGEFSRVSLIDEGRFFGSDSKGGRALDEDGETVFSGIYSVGKLSEGLLCATDGNGKAGYIDRDGKTLIPFEYTPIIQIGFDDSFRGGRAIVYKNGLYGVVDKTGKTVIPIEYTYVADCKNGYYSALLNNKYGILDKNGAVVIPLVYDSAGFVNDALVSAGEYGGESLLLDLTGKELAKSSSGFNASENGYIAFTGSNGKTGCIDGTGKTVIPFIYDNIGPFREGLAAVRKDGKFGYIDENGRTVIPFIYDRGEGFAGGAAVVAKDGLSGAVDKRGNTLIPFEYEYINPLGGYLYQVTKDGADGVVNADGSIVAPREINALREYYAFEDCLALYGGFGAEEAYSMRLYPYSAFKPPEGFELFEPIDKDETVTLIGPDAAEEPVSPDSGDAAGEASLVYDDPGNNGLFKPGKGGFPWLTVAVSACGLLLIAAVIAVYRKKSGTGFKN